jgi:hypothetical protein
MTLVGVDTIGPPSDLAGVNFDWIGVYDDGNPGWQQGAAMAAAYPGTPLVRITVFASDNEGDVLDVENGDATAIQAPDWVVRRRKAGHTWPTVYCSESAWPAVKQAFVSEDVSPPLYWVAAYPGEGAVVPAGAVAHQWIDVGPYDRSVSLDTWPPHASPLPEGSVMADRVWNPKTNAMESQWVTPAGDVVIVTVEEDATPNAGKLRYDVLTATNFMANGTAPKAAP